MRNIISAIFLSTDLNYILLIILILLILYILIKKGSIKICFDYKNGKIKIKVNEKNK